MVTCALCSLWNSDERPVVHAVDVVSRQDEHVRVRAGRDKAQVLADRVGGPLIPVPIFLACLGRQDADAPCPAREVPCRPVAYVVHQREGLVLREDRDPGQAAVCYVAQGEIDDPVNAAEGHRGFRAVLDEDVETASDAARKENGNYLPHLTISPLLYSFREKWLASTLG